MLFAGGDSHSRSTSILLKVCRFRTWTWREIGVQSVKNCLSGTFNFRMPMSLIPGF